MAYNTKEFLYLRPKKSYLQTFKATRYKVRNNAKLQTNQRAAAETTKNASVWSSLLKPYFEEYCRSSSIHCFQYFANDKLKCYEKFIWLLIVVATSVCCTIVYFDLAELYLGQGLQTTVADAAQPVFVVPFPSVGVCLRNRIDWDILNHQAAKRFLPPNADNQTLNTFYKFFESLADIKLYTLNRFTPLFDPTSNINLTLIDGINILEVVEYLTFPCEQVFSKVCLWRYKPYNCCDLFTLERTEMGFCYIFNSAVSPKMQEKAKNDPFYPYHNSYSGEGSGLDFEVLLDEKKMKPGATIVNGIYIMIKRPGEWHYDVKFINYNTFTKLGLTAQLTEIDKRVRYISPEKRRCLYNDETGSNLYKTIPGLPYRRANCRTRCRQEYVLRYCNCNLDLLFPNHESDNFTSCKPSDFKCIFEHASLFSGESRLFESEYIHDVDNNSMVCNCLNTCEHLVYNAFYSSFPLEFNNSSDSTKLIHLDIHYQSSYMLKYLTTIRYTIVELLANFGGIVGLFLGASLLSVIELVYYFTIGLYIQLHNSPLEDKNLYKSSRAQRKPRMSKISVIQPNAIFNI